MRKRPQRTPMSFPIISVSTDEVQDIYRFWREADAVTEDPADIPDVLTDDQCVAVAREAAAKAHELVNGLMGGKVRESIDDVVDGTVYEYDPLTVEPHVPTVSQRLRDLADDMADRAEHGEVCVPESWLDELYELADVTARRGV